MTGQFVIILFTRACRLCRRVCRVCFVVALIYSEPKEVVAQMRTTTAECSILPCTVYTLFIHDNGCGRFVARPLAWRTFACSVWVSELSRAAAEPLLICMHSIVDPPQHFVFVVLIVSGVLAVTDVHGRPMARISCDYYHPEMLST